MHFVFQYNTHGERTPIFTVDQHFNITKNNYLQGDNQLTTNGLRNAYSQGEVFKNNYGNEKYFKGSYDPNDYFIRASNDNPSVMSAYAFLLGTNPQQVEGLGLIQDKRAQSPISDIYVEEARHKLYLDRALGSAKPAYIYAGNSDNFFYHDIQNMYPKLEKDFNDNLRQAENEFEFRYGSALYDKLASLINVPRSKTNFFEVAKYLDDYICALSNKMSTEPFNFDRDTLKVVSEYFDFMIRRGILRDPAMNKIIAHPMLYSLLREVLFKAQSEEELDKWEGP